MTERVQAQARALRAVGDIDAASPLSERARCQRLEEHARRQEVLLSVVSHELRGSADDGARGRRDARDQRGSLATDEVVDWKI